MNPSQKKFASVLIALGATFGSVVGVAGGGVGAANAGDVGGLLGGGGGISVAGDLLGDVGGLLGGGGG